MKAPSMRVLALCSVVLLGACAEGAGPAGPGVEIDVAPLTLPGVAGVEYTLAVFNAAPANPMFVPAGTVTGATNIAALVWNQASVTSTQFGNGGGGDISYVGPCDADVQTNNYVALALKQVAVGAGGGSFTGTGPSNTAANAAVFATPSLNILDDQDTISGGDNPLSADTDPDFENPCPFDDPCVLDFLCLENQDVSVVFNLTVMRDANQGFFDIAVNFEDIFCSAKFDTCYDRDLPIELLFGDDSDTDIANAAGDALGDEPGRDWTGVYAMACTAGAQTGVISDILMSAVKVTCPGPVNFTLPISGLTPSAGNHSVSVNLDGVAGDEIVQYATYYGHEDLLCTIPSSASTSCNKAYLNIAINLEDLPAGCTLTLQATVQDAAKPAFTGGFPTTFDTSGTSYPYVDVVAAPLTQDCTQNPLNGGDGFVNTFYGSSMISGTDPEVMIDHSANGADPVAIPATATDTSRPTVTSVTPQDLAMDVAVGADITATFSESMNASTINASSLVLLAEGAGVGNAEWNSFSDGNGGSYFWTSGQTWSERGFRVNGLLRFDDWGSGTGLVGYYFIKSMTDTNLVVSATRDGAASFFPENTPGNLIPYGTPIAGSVSYSGVVATFIPNAELQRSQTYLAAVADTVADLAGNFLQNNYIWYFTTEPPEGP